MIGIESMQYALRNVRHRKARSFLTVLSVLLGIATIFIFVSFGLGLYGYVNDLLEGGSGDKVIVQAKTATGLAGIGGDFELGDSDVRVVKGASGVSEATGVYVKSALVGFEDDQVYAYLIGFDPDVSIVMELMGVDILEGRELRGSDSGKVVLGYGYLFENEVFGEAVRLNDYVEVEGVEMRVVGFYEEIGNPSDDANVYVVGDDVEVLYPSESNSYGWIVARVDADNVDWTVENIERRLRSSRDLSEGEEDFFVQSYEDMIEGYSSAMDIIIGFVILIALISVVVSAVNTANTMITSVIERTKEIGVIKSIGGTNSEVFGIFLFESAFLGGVAGVVGVLLGWGLSFYGGLILDNLGWSFLTPVFPVYLFVALICFAILTGAVSGAVPAWNASRTNIVDALMYE